MRESIRPSARRRLPSPSKKRVDRVGDLAALGDGPYHEALPAGLVAGREHAFDAGASRWSS